jgi:hypothetical protein
MQEDNAMTFLTVARQQIAMQQMMQPRSKTMNLQLAFSRLRGFLETVVLGVLVVPAMLGGNILSAQTPTSETKKPAQQQNAAAELDKPGQLVPEAMAAQASASPASMVLSNQTPNQARVIWDSRGLEIDASNSSLNQILRQVAADTGTKLEGLRQDQQVFGSYGPGSEREVLWKLLDGSGYNVLMIGGRDTDVPLEIVLSARLPSSPHTVANNQSRSEQPEPPPNSLAEAQRPQEAQNPFGIGTTQSDPQLLMQEILQRQQKIDQQQQQQDHLNNPQQ